MKANEVPEKIYVTEGMLFMTNPEITLRGNGNKIEYTRTDAFIEKACNFIRINAYKYRKLKFVKNKPTFDFRTDWLIEDLRNYMKGE